MSSRGTRGNCPRCPPLIRPWSRPVSAVLNLMAVHPTQHCSILEISFCFGTLNALHFDKSLHLCFTADFNIDYIFKHFVKIKLTLRHWSKWKKWEVEPVEARIVMQTSEKLCEVCALKLASFSLSQNCSALFVGRASTINFCRSTRFSLCFLFCLFTSVNR